MSGAVLRGGSFEKNRTFHRYCRLTRFMTGVLQLSLSNRRAVGWFKYDKTQ